VVDDEEVCRAVVVEGASVVGGAAIEASVVEANSVISGRLSVDGGPVVVGCDVDTGALGPEALVELEPPGAGATAVAPVPSKSAPESLVGVRLGLVDGTGSAAAVRVKVASLVASGVGAAVSGDSGERTACQSRTAATPMPAKTTAIRAFSTGRAIFQPLGNGSTGGVPRSGYGLLHTYKVLTNDYLSRSHPIGTSNEATAGVGMSALRHW